MEAKHAATPWQRANTPSGKSKIVDANGFSIANTTAGPYDSQQANADFIVRACNAHDDLVSELEAADRIIKSMLSTMSTEQKITVMDNLGTDRLTRHHERRAALAKATGSQA